MKMPDAIEPAMLAACGVLCTACYKHHKVKKPCGGCQGADEGKSASCVNCVRKTCADAKGLTWCFECDEFPCKHINSLDKSYRTRYGVNLVQNGRDAKEQGMERFLAGQRDKYLCAECGGIIC